MDKKINGTHFIAAAVLLGTVFAAEYSLCADPVLRYIFIYLFIAVGLYFSFYVPIASAAIGAGGLILLFTSAPRPGLVPSAGLAFLLAVTGAIPFLRRQRDDEETAGSEQALRAMDERIEQLRRDCGEWEKERNNLEHEIERINQLYLQGRELVEHMEMNEVADHLCRVLQNRPGIRAVAMFSREKDQWKPIHLSQPALCQRWMDFMQSQKQLRREKRFRVIPALSWMEADSVVFWPVRMEMDLLAAILLATDQEYAGRYREEGGLFIPQIALGLQRTALFSEVRDRSRKDGLTGLYLRRYFIKRLNTEIMRGQRYNSSFSLLMADIDHFKKINDTYGHLTGDHVLRTLAGLFSRCVRPGDLVGRFGGEEFIILLPMVTPAEAVRIARAVHKVAAEEEYADGQSRFHATISIGISHFPRDGTTADSLRSAADQALYWVKTHGRNGIREFSAGAASDKNSPSAGKRKHRPSRTMHKHPAPPDTLSGPLA